MPKIFKIIFNTLDSFHEQRCKKLYKIFYTSLVVQNFFPIATTLNNVKKNLFQLLTVAPSI